MVKFHYISIDGILLIWHSWQLREVVALDRLLPDCDPSLGVEGAKGRGMIQSDWLILRSLTKFQKMESILDK
ncbi:MAG: hypothetical protein CL997_07550 [Euryarchaeota archaeon]|nr:hypothetical protein [Euryarchaeota archaeon]